jgi:hypothetical protein
MCGIVQQINKLNDSGRAKKCGGSVLLEKRFLRKTGVARSGEFGND